MEPKKKEYAVKNKDAAKIERVFETTEDFTNEEHLDDLIKEIGEIIRKDIAPTAFGSAGVLRMVGSRRNC